MFLTAFYIFRPNDALKAMLESSDEEWVCLLSEPTIWSRDEYFDIGYSPSVWKLLRDSEKKMLFMLNLVYDYFSETTTTPSNTLQEFIDKLINVAHIRVDAFDKWWTLERFESLENTYEDALKRFPRRLFHLASGDSVPGMQEWLDEIKMDNSPKP